MVNYAYTLKNRIQEERREVSRETQNAMEAHYFKTGQIWTPKELDYLKGIGKLDTQGYSDMLRFSINEKESRIREARAEARLAQTLWASMATEEEKQWFKLQQQGTTVAMNTAEMKRLNVALAEGTLTPNMLIESQAKGLIMPTQRTMLYNQLTQQKAEYKKVYGEMAGPALKAARDMLTPLVGAGHVAQEDADDAIIALSSIYARQGVPVEQVDDAMRKVLTGIKFRSKPSDGFLMWGETDNYEVTVPIYEAIEGMKEIGIGAETEALFSGGKTAPKVPSKTKQVGLSGNGSVKLKEGTPEYKQWIKDNL